MNYNTILITGANRGIGLQFVKDLLKQKPAHLIATCRDKEKATELNKLASENENLHVLQLDVTDYSRYESLVNEIDKIVGDKGLQLIIQNAAFCLFDDLDNLDYENFLKVLNTNSVAPFLLTYKLTPLLKKSVNANQRTIACFISSIGGSIEHNDHKFYYGKDIPSIASYRMSKAALNQAVRTLAAMNHNEGIEFSLLHPGHVDTEIGRGAGIKPPLSTEESVRGMLKCLEDEELIKGCRFVSNEGKYLPW